MTLPRGYRKKGYKDFKGGKCPVDPDAFVDALVLTGQVDDKGHRLIGHSGVMRASLQAWEDRDHPILYYRVAPRQEPHDHDLIRVRWPHKRG